MKRTWTLLVLGLAGCITDAGGGEELTGEDGTGATTGSLFTCETDEVDCMVDQLSPPEQHELFEGGCWITGGGHHGDANGGNGAGKNDQDSFGFNAMGMKDGRVRGEIQVTTHLDEDLLPDTNDEETSAENLFHGHARYIRCYKDAGEGPRVPHAVPNVSIWGGHGTWNHVDGYTWEAFMADRDEGGSDQDQFGIRIWNAQGVLVYEQSLDPNVGGGRHTITGGNLQIHPPNGGHPYITGDIPAGMADYAAWGPVL